MRVKVTAWLLLVLIILFGMLFFINARIYPAMEALAQAKAEKLAIRAMHEAILISLSSEKVYDKLLAPSVNADGVYMLNADAAAMNTLSYECSVTAQKLLSKESEQGIKISVGTLSGIAPLSGMGPNIKIRFTPAANVQSTFESTLKKSGINQTLYRVKIILTAEIYIILPGKSSKLTVSTDAAIAESVIVGEVPQVYTNVEDEENMLELVPSELP